MKKCTLFFFALVLAVGTALAQNSDNKWSIGLGPGITHNLSTPPEGLNHDQNLMVNLYLSRYLNPSFDLMLDNRLAWNGNRWEMNGVDLFTSLLNLRYKLSNGYIFKEDSRIQPYLFGGVGALWDNDASGVTFDGGAGVKIKVSPNTSLYFAGSYVNGIEGGGEEPVTDNLLMATSIIEFAFGKGKDSDGDGVKDKKDECPDTPPGVQVDEKGCPLDRDGDGVPDYKDECPDEPGSAALAGCPDRDGDGIADKDDECPDVPGLAKFNGCPDSDGDGVPDHKDKCPDTPKGCTVDANGCPIDSDGDGVIDCEDNCPNEPGPASNHGCPDWVELDLSNILFDFDKSDLRPESKAELDKLAETLDASKEYQIVVGGHTDNIGTEAYNMGLSERRAQAVVKYLLMKGVNNAYVGSHNYGESKPLVPNTSRANRQENRRVEFEVAKARK